jgi:hypothetical protein
MKILITTSNKYIHLLTPHSILFNKYWPSQEIVYLGFDNPNVPKLPDNCRYVSLGKQSDFGSYWTNPILPYINSLKEDYFAITVEDVMLCGPVDLKGVQALEREVACSNADKAMLDSHLNWNMSFAGYMHPYKEGILELDQRAQYRTSLAPAIWRKEYFLRYCKPNMSCWDFELKNMPESQRDGATIISLAQKEFLVKTANVYDKGRPAPCHNKRLKWGSTSGITKEDILLIYKYLPEDEQKLNEDYLKSLKSGVLYH